MKYNLNKVLLEAKIKEYLIEQDTNLKDFASLLGITERTLERKLKNYSNFYIHEIKKLELLLNLSTEELEEIFFSKEVLKWKITKNILTN